MNFLNKLERKYGKYAIPNLMLYIVLGQLAVYMISYLSGTYYLYEAIYFNPALILKGQIWRLVSFVFWPGSNDLFSFLIMSLLYYSIGNTLEQVWGSFKFNVFYLLGMIFNMIGITFIQYAFYGGHNIPVNITTYLNLSLFIAYAALFPDVQFYLFFIIPVKAKYLAAVDVILYIFSFISSSLPQRVVIAMAFLNLLVFFGPSLLRKRPRQTATQRNFRRSTDHSKLKKGDPVRVAFHKCTVCGKTELTDPDMEFRYCSKCNGAHEYCMEHLHNHKHIE